MALEKLLIRRFRDPNFSDRVGDDYAVAINPEEYSRTYTIVYNCSSGQGAPATSPQFNRVGPEKVAFSIWFDGTGVVPSDRPTRTTSIVNQLTEFRKAVTTYDGKVHRPNFLALIWGPLFFNCVIDKLDITYTMFTPTGQPIRAKCGLSFTGYTPRKAAAKAANTSSPDLAHLVTVRAGDTLPLLCHQIYGSSAHYANVARFNGLDGFRALEPGMQLLFPRLRQPGR